MYDPARSRNYTKLNQLELIASHICTIERKLSRHG